MKFELTKIALEILESGETRYWVMGYGTMVGQGMSDTGYYQSEHGDIGSALAAVRFKLLKDEEFLTRLAKKRIKDLESEKESETEK